MKKIKILLVDDHHIILDGIKLMIQDEPNVEICGIAENGKKALELISEKKPNVIITDISMPSMSGIQLIELIRESDNETKIIILSMYATEDYICRAIKAGANAYLTKQDTTKEEIMEAINSTINGDEYYSPAVSKIIMKNYVQKTQKNSGLVMKQNSLTNREKEILILYAEGFSNQEIADKLFISVRTVDAHKNNIMQKFNFKSTVDMVKFAIKNNLIDI